MCLSVKGLTTPETKTERSKNSENFCKHFRIPINAKVSAQERFSHLSPVFLVLIGIFL
jgi:hypothetical protein